MTVAGMSPLAMMSMHEQYPWMKEKKSSRKQQIQGRKSPLILSVLIYYYHTFVLNSIERLVIIGAGG